MLDYFNLQTNFKLFFMKMIFMLKCDYQLLGIGIDLFGTYFELENEFG